MAYQIDQSGKIEQTNKDTVIAFSVGVCYLIDHLKKISEITIDIEYQGKDKIIKQFIIRQLEKNSKPTHNINFARIGNSPPAHYAAKDVFDRKIKADRKLTLVNFTEALKKTDGRLRECLSTLVDVQSRSISKRYHKGSGKSTRKLKQ